MADTIKITTLAQLKVALQAAKTYIDGQIGGLGTMAGKSEVAYDDLAAALKTLIDGKAAQATVDTLVGEDTGKSVRTISSEEVAKIVAGADKSYDTLKDSGSENIIDQTVNIIVRSHLTPFRKAAGTCLDYNIMLQQFVGCWQYLNSVTGGDVIFALINITVQPPANRYR